MNHTSSMILSFHFDFVDYENTKEIFCKWNDGPEEPFWKWLRRTIEQ